MPLKLRGDAVTSVNTVASSEPRSASLPAVLPRVAAAALGVAVALPLLVYGAIGGF